MSFKRKIYDKLLKWKNESKQQGQIVTMIKGFLLKHHEHLEKSIRPDY